MLSYPARHVFIKPMFTEFLIYTFSISRLKYVAHFSSPSARQTVCVLMLCLDPFLVGVEVNLLVLAPPLIFWPCPQRGQNLYEIRNSAEHNKQLAVITLLPCGCTKRQTMVNFSVIFKPFIGQSFLYGVWVVKIWRDREIVAWIAHLLACFYVVILPFVREWLLMATVFLNCINQMR